MRNWTLKDRLIHTVGYEGLAILLFAPAGAWILNKPLLQMGALSVLLSSLAMGWNMVYNVGFDRLFPRDKVKRGIGLRFIQAAGFEGGFILIGLPIAAFMLGITLWQTFLLEILFFLFYLPYTVVYNWLFDVLRGWWVQRKACRT